MRPSSWTLRIVLAAVAVASGLNVASIEGQSVPAGSVDLAPIAAGTKVRLSAPAVAAGRIEGLLLRADEESLTVGGRQPEPLRVPRETITRLEFVSERRGHALLGMCLGGLVGALVFGSHPCANEGCSDEFSTEYAVAAGVLGGLAGARIGGLIKSDRWSEIPLDRVRVGLAPVKGRGLGLSVSVVF